MEKDAQAPVLYCRVLKRFLVNCLVFEPIMFTNYGRKINASEQHYLLLDTIYNNYNIRNIKNNDSVKVCKRSQILLIKAQEKKFICKNKNYLFFISS